MRDVQRPTGLSRRTKLVVGCVVVVVLSVELTLGWNSLRAALVDLRRPDWGWLALAVVAEVTSMGLFARMQRRLLRAAGTLVPMPRALALAYSSHALSVSLPGGPMFSTAFNFTQMRRFGASPAMASWAIALSGVLSNGALAVIVAVAALLARTGHDPWSVAFDILFALGTAVVVRVMAQRPHWLVRPANLGLAVTNRLLHRPPDTGKARFDEFFAQLSTVQMRNSDLRIAQMWAVGNWAFDALCLWLCGLGVDVQLGITTLVVAYAAGMTASTVPIVPAGLGVVDGALVLGMVSRRVSAEDAIATVLLYRVVSLVLVVGAGWVLWWLIRSRQRAAGDASDLPAAPKGHKARLGWFLSGAEWRLPVTAAADASVDGSIDGSVGSTAIAVATLGEAAVEGTVDTAVEGTAEGPVDAAVDTAGEGAAQGSVDMRIEVRVDSRADSPGAAAEPPREDGAGPEK